MDWFLNNFLGSTVPITYDEETKINDIAGDEYVVVQRKQIGVIYVVGGLTRFMQEMKVIQDEVKR